MEAAQILLLVLQALLGQQAAPRAKQVGVLTIQKMDIALEVAVEQAMVQVEEVAQADQIQILMLAAEVEEVEEEVDI